MADKWKFRTVDKKIRGEKFDRLLSSQRNSIFKTGTQLGEKLRAEVQGQITEYSQFDKLLRDAVGDFDTKMADDYGKLLKPETQENLGKQLQRLVKGIDSLPAVEVDHTDMKPVNQALSLTIIALNDALEEIQVNREAGKADLMFMARNNDLQAELTPFSNISGLKTKTETIITKLRKLRLFSEQLELKYRKGNSLKDLVEKFDDYAGSTVDISYLKEKDLNFTDGKLANFKIVTKEYNRGKGTFENIIGTLRAATLGGKQVNLTNDMKEMLEVIKKKGPENITGSKAIKEVLGKQVTDTFKGKKPKKYKTASKKTVSKKRNIKRLQKPTKQKIGNVGAAFATTMRANKAAKATRESGSDIQNELNKLRTVINRRLGAEVRRNMGRPALINRTGRFSNSAELVRLTSSNKTIIGEYTYQFDPYQTFENLGAKKWPVGYNPKPLIAKSIRGLAEQYTDKKFTLRRV